MRENSTTWGVAVSLVLGIGLALGLLYVLSAQASPVSAAAGVGDARGMVAATATAGNVFTVCLSGACDFDTVQAAVDAADDGDEILVATGTYTGVSARAGVTQVVYISKSVTLRGGYTITNWHTPNPISTPTTLDAEGQGRVLYLKGRVSPTFEGLRLTGGSAEGLGGGPSGEDVGGGLYVNVSAITITGCHVMNSAAQWGSGIYVVDGIATLVGNEVVSNTAQRDDSVTPRGGGAYLQGSDALLVDNTFRGNSAEWGGGLYVREGQVSLISNRLADNSAVAGGGGLCTTRGDLTFSGNTLEGNRAELGGGAYLWQSDASVLGSTFSTNEANWGAGLYQAEGVLILSGSAVVSNTASRGAGGMCLDEGQAAVSGSTFVGNRALVHEGGGLYLLRNADAVLTNTVVADNQTAKSGSGLFVWGSVARLVHTTMARNVGLTPAPPAGGDSEVADRARVAAPRASSDAAAGVLLRSGEAVLVDTILVGHELGLDVDGDAEASLEGTLWGSGGWANGTDWSGPGVISRTKDYWGDPAFVDPNAGDFHIGSSSAALDRGVDAGVRVDADGDPRPLPAGGGFDLGADEYAEVTLSASWKTVRPFRAAAGEVLTYTILLLNEGNLSSQDTLLVDAVPTQTTYISGSASTSAGVLTEGDAIRWSGALTPHQPVTVTFSVTLEEASMVWNTAVVTDGKGGVTTLWALVNGFPLYLPFLAR
jgi:uncharacterized repeat protein (TIGR01451 family)